MIPWTEFLIGGAVARHPVARAGTIVTPTIAPLTISK